MDLQVISIIFIIFFTVIRPIYSENTQNTSEINRKNVLYLELLGNGGFYSLNYERMITDKISVRGGMSPLIYRFAVPLMVNYFQGSGETKLELGIGTNFLMRRDRNTKVFGTATVGLRYEPKQRPYIFKLSFTPLYEFSGGDFNPWGGISFGYRF